MNFQLKSQFLRSLLIGLMCGVFSACHQPDQNRGAEGVMSALQIRSAPGLSFNQDTFVLYERVEITPIVPKNVGGELSDCSIQPELPAGLEFSTLDCSIRGTPAAIFDKGNYTVIARNDLGTSKASILLSVERGPIEGLLSSSVGQGGIINSVSLDRATLNPFFESFLLSGKDFFHLIYRKDESAKDQQALLIDSQGSLVASSLSDLGRTCQSLFSSSCTTGGTHVLSDGRIVVSYLTHSNQKLKVVRFLADGKLDERFGLAGIFTLSWYAGVTAPKRILASGENLLILSEVLSASSTGTTPVLIKLRGNGSLDSSFGSSGVAFLSSLQRAHSLAVNSKNSDIYISGISSALPIREQILRLKSNGRLDSSFGSGAAMTVRVLEGVSVNAPSSADWTGVELDLPRSRLIHASTGIPSGTEKDRQIKIVSIDLNMLSNRSEVTHLASGNFEKLTGLRLVVDFWGQVYVLTNLENPAVGARAPESQFILFRTGPGLQIDTAFAVNGWLRSEPTVHSQMSQMFLSNEFGLVVAGMTTDFISTEVSPGVFAHSPSHKLLVHFYK